MDTADLTVPRFRTPAALLWLTTFVVGFGLMMGSANINFLLTQVGIGPIVPFSLQSLTAVVLGFAMVRFSGSAIAASLTAYTVAAIAAGTPLSAGNPFFTGGYILGFAFAGFIVAFFWKMASLKPLLRTMQAVGLALIGSAIIYLPGLIWLQLATGADLQTTLATGFAPFVVPDLIKSGIAALVAAAFLPRPRRAYTGM